MNRYRRNPSCACPRCRCSGYLAPVFLVTLGVLFLIDQYSAIGIGKTWPVLLIVIGIIVLVQRRAPLTGHVDVSQIESQPPDANPTGGGEQPNSEGQVNHG